MTLDEVISAIEDSQFAAESNLASGSKTFHLNLRRHRMVSELAKHMKEPLVAEAILKRVVELAGKPVQPLFENPFDTALTAYLTALEIQSPELLRHAAEAVVNTPNCWWAAEMSLRLLAQAHQGQMPMPISEPGVNPNALGANADTPNPHPTYRFTQTRAKGSISGHRRGRHGGRLAIA